MSSSSFNLLDSCFIFLFPPLFWRGEVKSVEPNFDAGSGVAAVGIFIEPGNFVLNIHLPLL